MEGDHIKNNDWLLPFSWLYGLGVRIRNLMFDCNILKSKSYDVPVICVGNITVGGTGKTPHTEYLINLLRGENQVAVLSRGYKRKTKGYMLAGEDSTMSDIGDEPYQMKHKFPFIHMAVDRDRCHGIEQLTKRDVCPNTDVIILDDAFQHRYVKPGMALMLMDYHRPIYSDHLLPAGRLREQKSGIERADIVIVTKCPQNISKADCEKIGQRLHLRESQKLFFTTFTYGKLYPLFNKGQEAIAIEDLKGDILLLSGIASPRQLEYDLSKVTRFTSLHFGDHHNFTDKDIAEIEDKGKGRTIVTTEKDAARLLELGKSAFSKEIAENILVLPILVTFINDKQEEFNQIITSYVRKNSRNSILPQNKNASKS